MYKVDEIKYKIDTVIQMSMFESDERCWDKILDIQRRLYEEFGLGD